MKKTLPLILISLLLLTLAVSCSNNRDDLPDPATDNPGGIVIQNQATDQSGENADRDTTVKLIKLTSAGGYSCSSEKYIGVGDMSDKIVAGLSLLTEGENTVPALTDQTYRVGYLWIDCNGSLYRLTPELDSICLVSERMGEGRELIGLTDEYRKLISDAYSYYPYDSFVGTYKSGEADYPYQLEHVFAADSRVDELSILDINLSNSFGVASSITLLISAKEDCRLQATLECFQSIDNLGLGDSCEVELKAGVPEKLGLSFVGFTNIPYQVTIKVDNTYILLTLDPRKEETPIEPIYTVDEAAVEEEIRSAYFDMLCKSDGPDLLTYGPKSPDELSVRFCAPGSYSGCYAVMLYGDGMCYTQACRTVVVAGYTITFSSGQPLYIYRNGEFHLIKDAHELGMISADDVREIGMAVDSSFTANNPHA